MNNNLELQSTMKCVLKQTAVIIPAKNEELSIQFVLNDLPDVACVIVANNGSTDRTSEIAADAGCVVVDEPIAGYGRACLAGMSKLRSLVGDEGKDIRFVAFIDADYSDHPEELIEMLRMVSDNRADFVLGSRTRGDQELGAMPPQAVWGNWLACSLMRLAWSTHYTDLGPFRVIRYEDLMQLGMQDLDFGWTIEMQIKAKQAGLRTTEVPASYRRRIGASKISGTVSGTLRAGYKILYTIAKYKWQTHFPSTRPPSAHTQDAIASVQGRCRSL